MKIAIICYQSVSFSEILSFLTPLEMFKVKNPQSNLSWEFCSYLPMHNGKPGLSLTTSYVGLPLQGFEYIYLPSPQLEQDFLMEKEWLEWLKTASSCPTIFSLKKGEQLLKISGFNDTQIITHFSASASAIFALSIIKNIADQNTYSVIKNVLNQEPFEEKLSVQRTSVVERKSAETQISVSLNLDGQGSSDINTGIAFLDHMLSQIAKHGLFDLNIQAKGDLEIDPHHTMEDTGLALGEAFRVAAGERKGIFRMASATIPMDESLAEVTIDFSGRPYSVLSTQWTNTVLAEIPTSLFEHFLESFANAARINLFVRVLAGKDNHHMSEAIFKALARALENALRLDPRRSGMIPSTKEVLF